MRYWVYMNGEVPGSFSPDELVGLKGFGDTTLVCPAEGEILEKNWRRSGEFADIIAELHARDARQAPPPPAAASDALTPVDVNAVIDTASSRLFSHVAELMKELESRREEKALTVSLQRQIVDLKDQLQKERERASLLESRMPRLAELEESLRKAELRAQELESAVKARDEGLAELRMQHEKTRGELEGARRRLGEALNDLSIRNRLVDKISRDLSEKEVSLAKALGLIRRLEEDLNRLCPAPGAGPAPAPAPLEPEPAAPPPPAVRSAERASYTTDEPPPPPPPPPSEPEQPAAQSALVQRFKKLLGGDIPS